MKRKKKKSGTSALVAVVSVLCVGAIAVSIAFASKKNAKSTDVAASSAASVSSAASSAVAVSSKEAVSVAVSSTAKTSSATKSSGTASTVSYTNTKGKTSKGFTIEQINGVTYVDGYLIANKTYSLPSTYGTALTAETLAAFDTLKAAAKEDGLNIYISSGFRSYDTQDRIYKNHCATKGQERGDLVSARPGHSEHQTGLAFDVNTIDLSFAGTPEAVWLENNCYKYGFILRYVKGKTDQTGYDYEPWHFRYVGKELAKTLYNDGDWLTMEEYFGITSKYAG